MNRIYEKRIYRKYREFLLCALDVSIVILSFILSVLLKFDFNISYLMNLDIGKSVLLMLSIVNVYIGCFLMLRIHRSLWKYVGPQEVIRLCLAVLLATFILAGCHFILYGNSRAIISTLILTGLLSVFMMLVVRLSYRLLRRNAASSEKHGRALIVGAGDAGYLMVKELEQSANPVSIIGYVDDYKVGRAISGYNVIGKIEELPKLIEKNKIDFVYVAIPSANKTLKHKILDLCVPMKVKVKIMRTVDERFKDANAAKKKEYPVQDVSIEDLLGRGEIKLEQQEISSYLGDTCVLVTGAGGSIGSELCRQIIRFKPKRLLMVDINENGLYMLEQEFNRMRMHETLDAHIEIKSYITSIRDKEALESLFALEHPDVVYHAAAHKHVPLMETRPMEAVKNNVFGTNNVIQTCIQFKVKRFIMISTDKAVNPTNVMGATKRMTELILQAHGDNGITKMAAVRFGNVLGSNGSVIPIFKNQIAEGGPITITDKRIERYFMTIPEAAQLVLQAGFYASKGEIFVLDMGKPVKILDLAEKLIRLSGFEPYKDIEIKEIGLRPGEKMYEELALHNEMRHKTKNDLIFVNERMNISLAQIHEKLACLHKLLDQQAEPAELKSKLMELISTDDVVRG